jgi:hypothetical protein
VGKTKARSPLVTPDQRRELVEGIKKQQLVIRVCRQSNHPQKELALFHLREKIKLSKWMLSLVDNAK